MNQRQLQLLCACLAGFAFSVNYTNHAPLASVLMKQFDFTKAMAGFLTTGIFATHALMQIPGGHLADKLGGKKILIAALLVVFIGNFGIAFSSSYYQLLLWKIFVGFGTGSCFVAGARYIAQVMPANYLAKAQGYYGASVLLGSGFVIFAMPQLADKLGWPGSFITTAVVALAVLFIWITAAPAPQLTEHPSVSLSSLLSHPQLWLLGFMQMASFGLVIVIGTWITELLKTQMGLLPKTAGAVGSIVLLLGIFARIYGGILVSKIGFRKLLAGSMLLNIAGCLILSSLSSSMPIILLAMVMLGLGCGLPYAALFNRAVTLFPGRGGAAMGLVNMLGIVMILAGAPLVGKLVDLTGNFSMAFIALGIFSLAALLASFGIKR